MRIRNKKDKNNIIDKCPDLLKSENEINTKKELHIEIGMGKGSFIRKMALNNPDISFVGMEKNETIMALAIENKESIVNLKYLLLDANKIDDFFTKKIDLIYLNFVDPWPKKRHEKRRLTHKLFLQKYDNVFKNNAHIKLKTDNSLLFIFSLTSLSRYGYTIEDVSLDFKSEENNMALTEYEKKFREKNVNIYYLEAIKKL